MMNADDNDNDDYNADDNDDDDWGCHVNELVYKLDGFA